MTRINVPAVIVSALTYWILGFIWYGVLFANEFVKIMGYTDEQLKQMESSSHLKELTLVAVCALVLAATLSFFIPGSAKDLIGALKIAILALLGFVLTTNLEPVLFEQRPLSLYVINNTFHLVGMCLMAMILSRWRKEGPVRLAYET